MYPSRGMPPSAHPGNNGSVYRTSYRTPQGARDHDRSLPTTRFGSTHNRVAAIGVGKFIILPTLVGIRECVFYLLFPVYTCYIAPMCVCRPFFAVTSVYTCLLSYFIQ